MLCRNDGRMRRCFPIHVFLETRLDPPRRFLVRNKQRYRGRHVASDQDLHCLLAGYSIKQNRINVTK